MGGNSGKSISVSAAMQAAISDYMFAEKITRTEFCKRTGWSRYGNENAHTVSLTTLNRILCGNPRNISKTMAKRLADTLGLSLHEFVTGKPELSGSIAADNGWKVSEKLEGKPSETPNGVSFFVRKVTHAETGTVGRGKFYCVSQFNMPEREQMRWRLTRHEIVGDLTTELDHPHLSSRLAVFSSADDYLVIDRWVEGRQLSQKLQGNVPSATFISTTMKGVAAGLAALHEKAIVLRWLDPRGIIVTDEGHATLVDFEFAKLTGLFRSVHPGHQLMDTGYLSPQVCQEIDIGDDYSADVYSWACILATLVSGTPWGARIDQPKDLIAASRLPARIRRLAEQCLEIDPGKRPGNGGELLKAIRRW